VANFAIRVHKRTTAMPARTVRIVTGEPMSILFVLLTFIVVIAVNYFSFRAPQKAPLGTGVRVRPQAPVLAKGAGFSVPQGYSFHPGHMWVLREGADNARVGLDKFAADLIGTIKKIEVADPSRWIRQGQRLVAVHCDGVSFDLMSPVEGVVMAVNQEVLENPALSTSDPYKNGWIATLKSPDLQTNQKNLLQGPMVAPWMHYNVVRLNTTMAQMNPALAQDGGVPVSQALTLLQPELRQKLVKDFFLN
jgi:glycine cleavage system H protein